jgi:hypothetical protein
MKMFIPNPPPRYEQGVFNTILDTVKRAMIPAVSIDEAVGGILLQSPDGSVYKLTVDNAGNLVTTAVPLGSR